MKTVWRPLNGLATRAALTIAAVDLMAGSREDARGNIVDATVYLYASMHCSAIRGGSLLAMAGTVYGSGMERVRGRVQEWASN